MGWFCSFFSLLILPLFASVYDLGDKLHPYSESDFFHNHRHLEALLEANEIQTVIEVGSWYGESAMFIAERLPPEGKLFAIDSWIGYPREIYQNTLHVYERFLSNVIHRHLTDKIIPIRSTSLSAARTFSQNKLKVDLIYIDGDHSYEAVYCDLKAWTKYLKKGGVLCGNSYSPVGESDTIKKAVHDYCARYKKTAEFQNNFWRIK